MRLKVFLWETLPVLFVLIALLCTSAKGGEITVVDKGESNWVIAIPDDATEVEQTAAAELQTHIKAISGCELSITTEHELQSGVPAFYIGGTSRGLAVMADAGAVTPLPFDTIFIRTLPEAVILSGHERRGALYAVYTLLEDTLGCRWWTPEETFIPKSDTISIPDDVAINYAPKVISREVYNHRAWGNIYSARNKGNGSNDVAHGGKIEIINFVHSFYHYISPDKYFEDHPEWFSEIDGKRTYNTAQLCLTNEEMRAELIQNLLADLRKSPNAKFIDLSQNDWYGFCTCEKCRAVDEEEGSQSGTLIHFINAVAEAVEKEFPDVYVETLAYQYTRKPPLHVKPRDNVLIRLCSIECDFSHSLEHPVNKAFAEDLRGWRAIAKSLFIWDYLTDYHDYTGIFPNYNVIVPNLRYFIDSGAIGIFNESEGEDFCELRNWLLHHLMWDPSQSEEELFNDFCNGYYGEGMAPLIREYQKLLAQRAADSGEHIGCFAPEVRTWLDYKTLVQATDIMNRAGELVQSSYGKDSAEYTRISKARLALDRTWLKFYDFWRLTSAQENLAWTGPDDPVAACSDFIDRCRLHKITQLAIDSGTDWEPLLLEKIKMRYLKREHLAEIWQDLPAGESVIIDDASFANYLEKAERIEDVNAWNGRATSMPTEVDWNVNFTPALSGPYRTFVRLRCDASTDQGDAMSFGVYDWKAKVGIFTKTVTVEELRGSDYKWVDFGTIDFTVDAGFWFAHRHDPNVSRVFVDVIVFIKPEETAVTP
ncbi:MAG: DUF4838 domain-containing protein [Planctomycetia bacterium]|nr:DUF4838 domain-containing protein [Planctomycetia bacterium]